MHDLLLTMVRLALATFASAQAASFGIGTTAGVMQQPTSHYYHATYGLEATTGSDSQRFLLRASYVERPEFSADGYADKDYGWFGQVGSKLTKKANQGLYAFIGGGRMAGYTKLTTAASSAINTADSKIASAYIQSGLSASIDYAVRWGRFDLAAGHQIFIGVVDRTQLQGYVAWPYTFFHIRAGTAW